MNPKIRKCGNARIITAEAFARNSKTGAIGDQLLRRINHREIFPHLMNISSEADKKGKKTVVEFVSGSSQEGS